MNAGAGWTSGTLLIAMLAMVTPGLTGQALEVRVVDVGPGLCTITTIPGDHYIIYDAGHWTGRRCITAVEEIVDGEVIDLLVISHSDSDHLGDADEILEGFDVERIVWTGHRRPGTATWESMNEAIANEALNLAASVRAMGTTPLVPGEALQFGGARITFLAGWNTWTESGPTASERRNVISVVMRLEYDGRSILYTGDTVGRRRTDPEGACKDAEAFMVQNDSLGVATLDSDVMIAPHHGGNNGSATCFIAAVDPSFVIFSAGHSHDHPTRDVAMRYLDHGVPILNIFRTDRGDDEGGGEWNHLRVPGCRDPRGDDDVQITVPTGAPIRVRYVDPTGGC